jgi:flagellar protein FliT
MIRPQLAATGQAQVARICRMPSQIDLYEEMSLLSSRMAAAARASDWEQLIELEHGIRHLRDALLAIAEDGSEAATDLARKHSLIQRILQDDAEVRRHTEPWMERILYFLGDGRPRREFQGASGESPAAG